MLTFTPVTQRDIARLRRYYKSCEYQLCEYSALVKLMWRSHLHPSWAEGAGCLIVRNFIDGQYCFDYPVPGPDGDEDAAELHLLCIFAQNGSSAALRILRAVQVAEGRHLDALIALLRSDGRWTEPE